jgi:DNA modification methylase
LKIAGYEVHHIAEFFPLVDAKRLDSLAASIEANGQRDPIAIYEGKILDGRNRARACEKLGIAPKVISFVGDPWEYVKDKNAQRRDLEGGQRTVILAKMEAAQLAEETAREANEKRTGRPKKGEEKSARPDERALSRAAGRDKTATKIATKADSSVSTAKRAMKLIKAAEENPRAAELVEAVVKGERTLNSATNEIDQAQARAKSEAEAKASTERAIVHRGNAGEFLRSFAPKSVDLLLTDPPYSTDIEDILGFATWLNGGMRILAPTGRAYVCVGAYPEELHAYLEVIYASEFKTRSQVLVWTYRNTMGPKPTHGYKLNWQAVLYLWGEKAAPLDCPSLNEQFAVQDINAPDGRRGDRYHAWQKPDELGDRFVRHATKPGDLVVDPFAGTGSFLLSAARLGRRAIGCDISADNLKIAEQRGCIVEKAVRCG